MAWKRGAKTIWVLVRCRAHSRILDVVKLMQVDSRRVIKKVPQ